jgi:L-rhamnonate dehydratase
MKIQSVKAFYPNYKGGGAWRSHLWQIVVRVETDVGLIGYGYGGGGEASLPIVNGHFHELLEGTVVNSVEDIDSIWDRLYFESIPYGRKGIAMMALSGVDLALWDLLGKAEGKPVAALISDDLKTDIACYGTGRDAEYHAESGYYGTKTPHRWTGERSDADQLLKWAEVARDVMGPDRQLMVDAYMSWDSEFTESMGKELAGFNIYWFEDVLTPDDLEGQSVLRQVVGDINIAGGEHEFGKRGYEDIARTGALDIWQPDITWCGGITAGIRIVDLAGEHGIPVVPHRGAEIWGLHLIAATACDNLAEWVTGGRNTGRDDPWVGMPEPIEGRINISDAPGFGVTPDESRL